MAGAVLTGGIKKEVVSTGMSASNSTLLNFKVEGMSSLW